MLVAVEERGRETRDSSGRFRVVIAGAGPAGVEAALALQRIAGGRVITTFVAPERFVHFPPSARSPFAIGDRYRVPLDGLAGADLVQGRLISVDPTAREASVSGDETLTYDALLVAVGANQRAPYPRALVFGAPDSDERMHGLIQDLEDGYIKRVAFVIPSGASWSLPIYELALMTAARAFDMCVEVELTLVTPEPSPLAIFGEGISQDVAHMLADAGIAVRCRVDAEPPRRSVLELHPTRERLDVDRVVTLPILSGPAIGGLPHDASGFLPVDDYGRVAGLAGVYAAGDATDFEIKQGGIACRQADAAAEAIAADAGVAIEPTPFRAVLRGLLLTEHDTRWMQRNLGHRERGQGRRVAANQVCRPGALAAAARCPGRCALRRAVRPRVLIAGGGVPGRRIRVRPYTRSPGVPSRPGRLHVAPGDQRILVHRIVTVPRLVGSALPGVPCDRDGFSRTYAHGRVLGLKMCSLAGDATAFAIRRRGLAAQQGDAVAESIAASVDADVAPRPFRPFLTGLLTGQEGTLHGRSHPHRHEDDGSLSERPLWWPPNRLCGRYLAPYLSSRVGGGADMFSDQSWPSGSIPRRSATRASSASGPTSQPAESSCRDPYQYENARPASEPGIAHSPSPRPGGLAAEIPGAGSAYPLASAPSRAARNAPTIPPQKRSGTSTAKCHSAMPIMAQTRTLTASSLEICVAFGMGSSFHFPVRATVPTPVSISGWGRRYPRNRAATPPVSVSIAAAAPLTGVMRAPVWRHRSTIRSVKRGSSTTPAASGRCEAGARCPSPAIAPAYRISGS